MKAQRGETAARLFDNDFLEAASKGHPAIPFLLYGPLVLGLLAYDVANRLSSPLELVASFAVGWVAWAAMEYLLHRYLFHWEGNGPVTRKMHAILHGYHHDYPNDPKRLVMPIGASLPLAIVIALGLWALARPWVTVPGFCGLVSGYMAYDFIHWSVHARKARTAWGRAIRKHHLAHHFACPDRNFGISHRWVDKLVGSLRDAP